jgi:hypothetical protein
MRILGHETTPQEKFLASAALALAAAAVAYIVLLEPFITEWRSLDGRIRAKRATLAKSLRLVAEEEPIRKAHERWAKGAKASAFKEEDVTSGLSELEQIAKRCSVFIASIKPQATRELSGSREILLDVSAEGTPEALAQYLYEVEGREHLFRVKRFTVSPGAKEARELKCNFLVRKRLLG